MAFGLSKIKNLLKKDIAVDSAKESILGVDIGASAVKFVQIHSVKDVPTLETYGELQLGPYEGIEIGRTTNLPVQKIIEALSDILKEAGATGKRVVYAFSYGSSFTNTILLPTLNHADIDTMLPVEARKYIPTALSKVTLDWLPIGTHTDTKQTNVLLSAVYNKAQTEYEQIMNGCGLVTVGTEVEIFSTIRATVSLKDEVVAVLDCGASATRLYIVEKGLVAKTHSIPLSGVSLTKDLAQGLSIEFEKAEELKREFGLLGSSDNKQIQDILAKSYERGVRELHTVLKRYSEFRSVEIQTVILSGGGALMKGIKPYLSDAFSLPIELADPFSKVAYPAFLEDTLSAAGSTFAVAVGTALRGFQDIK